MLDLFILLYSLDWTLNWNFPGVTFIWATQFIYVLRATCSVDLCCHFREFARLHYSVVHRRGGSAASALLPEQPGFNIVLERYLWTGWHFCASRGYLQSITAEIQILFRQFRSTSTWTSQISSLGSALTASASTRKLQPNARFAMRIGLLDKDTVLHQNSRHTRPRRIEMHGLQIRITAGISGRSGTKQISRGTGRCQ